MEKILCRAKIFFDSSIWLLDVARSLPPTVQLDGFDIDLAQCPASQWLPANVRMSEWDMFSEPPADLVGKYDVVHVRCVVLVIKNGNPDKLVANLKKLLSMIFSFSLQTPI